MVVEETSAVAPASSPVRLGPAVTVGLCAAAFLSWYPSLLEKNQLVIDEAEELVPTYTLETLLKYDGRPGSKGYGMLLAVFGRVFNVTSAPEFYGEDGSYRVFVGHDCTRAFAMTSTKKKWLDKDLDGLSEAKIQHLNSTYWDTYVSKYPIVGRLANPPYNPVAYDAYAGPFAQIRVSETKPRSAKPAQRQSRCPVTRAARAFKSAVVSLLPRQLLER
mmetsp:Transcript_111565/g.216064  ORF Transcript_111565/g.216064 Transcript_111565/m.216064 type:complete len:218 (-) Transcript_111565:49-702(-)